MVPAPSVCKKFLRFISDFDIYINSELVD